MLHYSGYITSITRFLSNITWNEEFLIKPLREFSIDIYDKKIVLILDVVPSYVIVDKKNYMIKYIQGYEIEIERGDSIERYF